MSAAAIAPSASSPPPEPQFAAAAAAQAPPPPLNATAEHYPQQQQHNDFGFTKREQSPLPVELRKILADVATKGRYPKLPWLEQPDCFEYKVPRNIPRNKRPLPPPLPGRNKRSRARRHVHHHRTAAAFLNNNNTNSSTQVVVVAPAVKPSPVAAAAGSVPPMMDRFNNNSNSRRLAKRPGGWASGSEQDDCDSESTSVTSVSELSFDFGRNAKNHVASSLDEVLRPGSPPCYKSLSEVFRETMGHVLEYFYKHRGGYTLSTAEMRKIRIADANNKAKMDAAEKTEPGPVDGMGLPDCTTSTRGVVSSFETCYSPAERQRYALETFQRRKERMIALVGGQETRIRDNDSPPFTLQRIAEVLVDPERYYTQTHKLCNSLEKLLLVSTSVSEFGGSFGGDAESVRSYFEDKEASRERRRASHHRRAARKGGTPIPPKGESPVPETTEQPNESTEEENLLDEEEPEEILDAAARASLRAKFEHIGLDRHAVAEHQHNARTSPGEKRHMTGSPPPPGGVARPMMTGSPPPPSLLPVNTAVGPLLRPQPGSPSSPSTQRDISNSLARLPAPMVVYNGVVASQLQLNHAAAVAGVSPFQLLAGGSDSESDFSLDDYSDDQSNDGSSDQNCSSVSQQRPPSRPPLTKATEGTAETTNAEPGEGTAETTVANPTNAEPLQQKEKGGDSDTTTKRDDRAT